MRIFHDNRIKTTDQHANSRTIQQQLVWKGAQWYNSNNDFPFFGPQKKSKKWEAIRCSPLRNSLSALFGLLSSSAMFAETYNSKLPNCTKKKKIKKKELHRESWVHMDNQRSQWSCPYMCRISNSAFVSKFNSQPRPRNSKNRKQSQKRVTIDNHSSQTHIRSFKFDFLK